MFRQWCFLIEFCLYIVIAVAAGKRTVPAHLDVLETETQPQAIIETSQDSGRRIQQCDDHFKAPRRPIHNG